MPTYAENLIGSVTVGAGGASTITFSSIPSTYTDLVVRVSSRNTSSAANWNLLKLQFNTDTTAANYSYRLVGGFGTTAYSASGSDRYGGYVPSDARTANTFGNTELYIPNYTGSTNKSFSSDSVTEGNGSSYEILGLWSGLWSNTAAINQIVLSNDANNFAQYTTAYLYGITGAETAAKATGGIVTTDGTYWIHTFKSTGTFTPKQNLSNVDYLVVAGGGGGGYGGGGAGGLRSTVTATGGGGSLESKVSFTASTAYTVTVGGGGPGSAYTGATPNNGTSGSDSSISGSGFTTITSTGGGYGGNSTYGGNGGSGGGGGAKNVTSYGGSGTANQGYAGSGNAGYTTDNSSAGPAGGGGGAGGIAPDPASGSVGANGGVGVAVAISGSSVYYGGGGGGGMYANGYQGGNGGNGGGGNGYKAPSTNPTSGTDNTGGGGGGGKYGSSIAGGAGGSGIVIIRYAV